MRVLLLMPLGEQRGGGEVMLLELLRNADSTGINWTLVVFEEGSIVDEARLLGVETVVVSAGRLRQARSYVRTVRAVARFAKEADLVFSWMPKAHLYGGPAALLARKPSIWFQHGVPSRRSWMDRVATFIPAKGVLTPSRRAATVQSGLWPSRPTTTVYPGVDLGRFDPQVVLSSEEARDALGLPRSLPIVGVVARLQPSKGLHLVVDALPALQRASPDVVVVIVGGGHFSEPEYENELRRSAERLGVAEHVILAGLQQDVPTWMSAMDVVVHPAYNDSFGISIIEAMAMGKPVVASDSGGPPEIIQDGTNGLLFRTGDTTSLAAALDSLLGDQDEASRIGENARKRAEAFSSARLAIAIGDAVRSILAPEEQVPRETQVPSA